MQTYKELLLQLQENPRLRVGLVLILAIVLGNGLLMLNDYRKELFDEYSRQQKNLLKLNTLQKETGWVEKAESIKNIRLQFENQLWKASSKGLAQANVQTWFNDKIKILNLKGLEIAGTTVETDPKTPALWQVKIEVKGTLYDLDLLELLNHIEQSQKLMQIDQIQWHRGQNNLLGITLQASAYFHAQEQE